MIYQVLARKWRPRSFSTLVGQEHVVKALTHALDEQRLHHAYLFTGTRGVGKTTLARILAKALNCEVGVGSAPCGVCSACTEIDSGRFVDYIEMDAASNRGVDDMTQLLEQATYAPSRGRYKVYVIDEVHQLSGHAFNAMLKTLEEPPEHVKFVLATTDPQKIPVTVLSRCLQFNLKQMPQAAVVAHLARILKEEGIAADSSALKLIARAGAGSMRDALSLLDQAIAHGAGSVVEADVRDMLGTVDADLVFEILEALLANDPDALMNTVELLASRSLSFETALQELAGCLVRIQIAQFSKHAISTDDPSGERILELANRFHPDFIQLGYQIAVQGRQDLPFAPEAAAGFTMTLLRMFAFRPGAFETGTPSIDVESRHSADVSVASSADHPQLRLAKAIVESGQASLQPAVNSALVGGWRETLQSLRLSGMVRELAQHCVLREQTDASIRLSLAPAHRHLLVKPAQEKLQQALSERGGQALRLTIDLEDATEETPASLEMREKRMQQNQAVSAIEGDGFVREVVELFDATIIDSSIKHI